MPGGWVIEALNDLKYDTRLLREFFSHKNIKFLQRRIKVEIYKRTKGKVIIKEDQDERDLYNIMIDVFVGRTGSFSEETLLKDINGQALETIVGRVTSGLLKHVHYISTLNNPTRETPDAPKETRYHYQNNMSATFFGNDFYSRVRRAERGQRR